MLEHIAMLRCLLAQYDFVCHILMFFFFGEQYKWQLAKVRLVHRLKIIVGPLI